MRYVHTILRKALADAERKGLVQRNVANLASPPSAKAAKAPEASTWMAEQLRAFLDTVADHEHFALFHVAGHTGMRWGEILGLAWPTWTPTPARSVSASSWSSRDSWRRSRPSAAGGFVDLDDETVAVLGAHRKATAERRLAIGAGWVNTGLVFVSIDGRAMRSDAVTKAFASAVARSGLPRIRFHDLRHSRASHLARAGAHPVVIQTQLGHSPAKFSQEVYTHVDRDRAHAAAKAVGELLAGI